MNHTPFIIAYAVGGVAFIFAFFKTRKKQQKKEPEPEFTPKLKKSDFKHV